MSTSDAQELKQVEQLLIKGQFKEALQITENVEKKINISANNRLKWRLLKCTLLIKFGHFESALGFAKDIFKECQNSRIPIQELDALIILVEVSWQLGKFKEGLNYIEQGEKKLESLIQQLRTEYSQEELIEKEAALAEHKSTIYWRTGKFNLALESVQKSLAISEKLSCKQGRANSLNTLGIIFAHKGDLDQALEYFEQSLALQEELANKEGISLVLNSIGFNYRYRGDLNLALKYLKKSLALRRELGNNRTIAMSLNNIGDVYRLKGELDLALECFKQDLMLREKVGNIQDISESLYDLGSLYTQKGEWNEALEHFQKSLVLREEIGNNHYIAETLFKLVSTAIDKNAIKQAQEYLQRLEILNKSENRGKDSIDQRYRLAKAIFLKAGESSSDSLSSLKLYNILTRYVNAQQYLQQIVEERVLDYELTVEAIFNLCEFLIVELITFGNENNLTQVKLLANRLFQLGNEQRSDSLLAKTNFLMARLNLLEMDVQSAQKHLNRAYEIATEKGYDRLAIVISKEQKRLTGEIPEWLLDKEVSLLERLEKMRLKDLLVSLRQNRVEYFTEQPFTTPSMEEFEAFASELSKRKFEW